MDISEPRHINEPYFHCTNEIPALRSWASCGQKEKEVKSFGAHSDSQMN